ncbi:MAG: response regulator transcription factor [Hydrococcus sp. C42_A2020_068]|uniref:response regulator transcription factor n=1 Tax=Pleurocapsa sp. PCC 7327 TaxID=118163 RepID=UPI00029FB858|nr:response regulator transcription factor [Pleurocapsa sp. PCC 7327]AFY79141.1 response regulator containing a CheY-like receiver domain and an HTH DNA-binding domain [Pleurocapsa sp. PCC 7327]MBF2020746.1 response regulator transcription factor [Hydrococcus sp. C42_A2020_068]
MIRLLLVDDQSLICQGLQALLGEEPDLEVVGCAENGQVALDAIASLQPDVVLMDIRMPIMTGIEATRLIKEQFPDIKVLVLSTFDDDRDIAQSMRAGAKGYLLKDMPAPELADAIRFVHRGYSQMAPGLMEKLVMRVPDSNEAEAQSIPEELVQLPPRERDVLRLIGQGCTNREIATQLHLAEGTIKTYVTHLLNRLTFKNRSQLAIYANAIASSLNS